MSELAALFEHARQHALDYREAVARDPRPLAADYHQMRGRLTAPLPETGAEAASVIDELVALAEGGLMPITGPRFFGWVMGASNPVGVAADWLVSAWGQNAGYHTPTPAAAAFEEAAEAWLLELLDLPRQSGVGFATGATVANGTCLAAARTATLLEAGWDPDADGLFGAPPVHVLIGADAHSSLFSSLQLIGFGYRRVIKVETDAQGRMLPAALERAMKGLVGPKIVIAQAGQINTGAFDPFAEIAPIARAQGAWLHVDGAFGLWARATASRRQLTEGLELFDSWCTDGHKWLQAPYDTGFAIVRDKQMLARAMTQWSTYLPTIAEGDRVPSAYVPELSRRARGIPVWAVIRALGRQGIAAMVERHCSLSRRFAERLAAEPGIRILNDVVLNQVAVNFGEGDAASRKAATEAVIARVQHDGVCFVGGAQWRDDWIMRLSVISGPTTEADVDLSAQAVIRAWRAVQAG
ncbi:MAG TPA: aminotransferase class V-fold PLP-dependent enzyme [Devosia sp.]|nr:aminotransferase class V-fold PLP-dependent enzyme [Devosia sp.]